MYTAASLVGGGSNERPDLLGGVDLDVAAVAIGMPLDLGCRIQGQAPNLLRAHEDAVQHIQDLVAGPGRDRSPAMLASCERRLERLDRADADVLEPGLPERWQEVDADDRAVVLDRGGLAAAVLGDVAEVLGAGVGERRTAADQPRERAPAGLVECRAEPVLGEPLGEVAGRRPTAPGPNGTEPPLHLPPVRQPVLRVPLVSALALDAEHVPCRNPGNVRHDTDRAPARGHIGGHSSKL